MLFVHIPKCGGIFAAQAFGRRSRLCVSLTEPTLSGHLTWLEYRDRMRALGYDIAEYVTFAVVRNPFQWHVSWFNYIRRDKDGKHSGMPQEHELFQNFSFLDYLRWLDDPLITGMPNQYYLMQISDWVLDENGVLSVSEILRQETLENDLSALAQKHDLLIRIPKKKRNVSFKGDYRAEYNSEGIEIVTRRHARDLEMFGYSFDPSHSNV